MEESGEWNWLLARKALGASSSGFNLVEIGPGGRRFPSTMGGGSGQAELYVLLKGEAVMRLDGEENPAPTGTFASIDSEPTHTILNHSDAPVTALLIGVQPEGGLRADVLGVN